ncbi:MAG: acylneuraminate cytidylyltransferase family protein [Candidatus Paceibacterota bacterium]|jgi:CMP-N-acetylneuraminic acid synthetase
MNQDRKKYNILGVIPARGQSKGLPGKNIKKLAGKPMIAYTIEAAKKSQLISHLIVSTDDKKIAAISKKYGVEVPFLRPAELAKDDTPQLPVMQHAINFMEQREGLKFDYIVILQPTSPLKTVEIIDGTLDELIKSGADSAVSIAEVRSNHPIKIKKFENGKVIPFCLPEPEGLRRQDFPKAYKRSSDAYAMKRDTIMVKNRLYGDNIAGFVVDSEFVVDIDSQEDFLVAEYKLKKFQGERLRT